MSWQINAEYEERGKESGKVTLATLPINISEFAG
jgi:hypothetical protein